MSIFQVIKRIVLGSSDADITEAVLRLENRVPLSKIISFLSAKGHNNTRVRAILLEAIKWYFDKQFVPREREIKQLQQEEEEILGLNPESPRIIKIKERKDDLIKIIDQLNKKRNSMFSEADALIPLK